MAQVLSEETTVSEGEQTFDAEGFDLSCQTLEGVVSYAIANNF
jgi:hypothetical protein